MRLADSYVVVVHLCTLFFYNSWGTLRPRCNRFVFRSQMLTVLSSPPLTRNCDVEFSATRVCFFWKQTQNRAGECWRIKPFYWVSAYDCAVCLLTPSASSITTAGDDFRLVTTSLSPILLALTMYWSKSCQDTTRCGVDTAQIRISMVILENAKLSHWQVNTNKHWRILLLLQHTWARGWVAQWGLNCSTTVMEAKSQIFRQSPDDTNRVTSSIVKLLQVKQKIKKGEEGGGGGNRGQM